MRVSDAALDSALTSGFTRHLLVDILDGTSRVARDVFVDAWSLEADLDRDPKTTGQLTLTHSSVRGESWAPEGIAGLLSPFRSTLLLTEVINAGQFETRVQLGLFDVVAVPRAEDFYAQVNYLPGSGLVPSPVLLPDVDLLPGWVAARPGHRVVVASQVTVDVVSLDQRVLDASFRSPRAASGSAWDQWRAVGLLPVIESGSDASIPATVWPAEAGSRLDAVQHCARLLGGVPVVDSFGQWILVDDDADTVELVTGEHGTVVDTSSELTTDGFFNVVVGDYETEDGRPIHAEWSAPGSLSPDALGREWVRYHSSDMVRSQASADAAVASVGALSISREVDVQVECVHNPLIELGDHVTVDGVSGVAWGLRMSDGPLMGVTVRTVRSLL